MIQLIRGFRDILPGDIEIWQKIERTAVALFEDFGFREIRIPVLEKAELFARSIGEDTDIVEKEMYTFSDRKGDLLTLRPEATASIVRSYIQHQMYAQDPIQKFYTIGPMFRRERPQKGRYRQFYQINAEVFGIASPLADAQLIQMLMLLFERLSVTDVEAHVNSLGCPECRPAYKTTLSRFFSGVSEKLCPDCQRRRYRNPLRVLDCKVPTCREAIAEAPSIVDTLCPVCTEHFGILNSALQRLGIPFVLDPKLVRGLDYYTRATFEIQTGSLGAQSAIAGGGRYDGLVKALGGPDQSATGFAIGFDRLAEIVSTGSAESEARSAVFIAALGQESQNLAFEWVCAFGQNGIRAEMDFEGRSLKSQMKRADKLGARIVIMLGNRELEEKAAVIRDMETKQQESVALEAVVETVKRLGNSLSIKE